MSRYIDADNLVYAKVLDNSNPYACGWNDAIDAIRECEPTADVVDVVRCKDCVYYHPSYCEGWSKYGTIQTRESGFCYKGRK